jgi:hypothetical protein
LIATPPPISMEGKFMGVLVTPVKKHSWSDIS